MLNNNLAMQDLERVKYIRMKTFKKGTEEREDLMVAYRKWAVKIADEKKKRIEEVTEARRKKLKEDYFREQAKKQRKKGYMGMKQLVQKHISELKTTNTALGNDGEEHDCVRINLPYYMDTRRSGRIFSSPRNAESSRLAGAP